MRVVYFVSLFPCWSETFIVREITALMALGVDVRIVSLKLPSETLVQSDAKALLGQVLYPPRAARAARLAAIEVLLHPLHSLADLGQLMFGFIGKPKALAKSVVAWWRTLAMLGAVRRLRPDHLHAHWATYPSTAAMFAARRLRRPFSFTAHAHDIFLEDHLLAAKLKCAAFSVTISQYNREFLDATVGSALVQNTRIIHCGVSPSHYDFAPGERQRGFILAVGRLDPIKGFTHLVDACGLMAARGIDFICQIVGEGPLRAELAQRIADLRLQDKVQLLGARPHEDVRRLLNTAAVFVLPSVITPQGDRDGIPVALMEAMACGTPVVSTRVSGIPELVVDGNCGLLAAPGNAIDLAHCIERQLSAPALESFSRVQQARRAVEVEFNVATETSKLHAAIVEAGTHRRGVLTQAHHA